jgi:hypothetical protein
MPLRLEVSSEIPTLIIDRKYKQQIGTSDEPACINLPTHPQGWKSRRALIMARLSACIRSGGVLPYNYLSALPSLSLFFLLTTFFCHWKASGSPYSTPVLSLLHPAVTYRVSFRLLWETKAFLNSKSHFEELSRFLYLPSQIYSTTRRPTTRRPLRTSRYGQQPNAIHYN